MVLNRVLQKAGDRELWHSDALSAGWLPNRTTLVLHFADGISNTTGDLAVSFG